MSEKEWRIRRILNFTREKCWQSGFAHFGFHGKSGSQYLLQWDQHWLGRLTPDDRFLWTAGSVDKGLAETHIFLDVNHPHYVSESPDGSLVLSSNGNNKVFRIWPQQKSADLFIDTAAEGLVDVGNCVYDPGGNLWIHEIQGCRVWQFDMKGRPLRVLWNGISGFQSDPVSFDEVRFNWIYDMRLGPDGNIYVLDSKSFAVRKIDIAGKRVTTVVGTGGSGYSGDGGDASQATLGSKPDEHFDGPFSMALDERGEIFIGDTYNHVVRMVDISHNLITTIAGSRDSRPLERNDPNSQDPMKLNLPKICSMDYYQGSLFIPDENDDLVVLEENRD